MNDLINFLTSKEIIVVYIVASLACLLCFVIHMIDKNYYKRKQRHNTKELNKLVEQINEIIEKEENEKTIEVYQEPILEAIEETAQEPVMEEQASEKNATLNLEDLVLETITKEAELAEEKVEEELQYTSIEPNKKEAQEELMRLTLELEKAEQESKNIDLTSYEASQEENAIISLEELIRKSKEMYEANELTQYADEGNEPISLDDLEKKMKQAREMVAEEYNEIPEIIETLDNEPDIENTTPQQMHLDDFNTIKLDQPEETLKKDSTLYQTTKKFEISPVISPIYGIEKRTTQEEIELENTANYEKLDEEIKKTNEFLMTLRELQKNLD